MVGGLISSNLRLLHLEMDWAQTRSDLRKYYTRMRNDRAMLQTPLIRRGPERGNPPLDTEEAILAEAKRKGLFTQLRGE